MKNLKSYLIIFALTLLMIGLVLLSVSVQAEDVQSTARRASVQTVFYVPVMKVFFVHPLDKEKALTKDDITKLLDQKIKEATQKEREWQSQERYETSLTDIEQYGVLTRVRDQIALGILAPGYARFPERVLVVYKTEKKDLRAWEKDFDKDVLTISETANVSPQKANEIVNNLRMAGYSISKDIQKKEEDIRLLWFSGGWDTKWPIELPWEVKLEGSKDNLIIGYDPRGILQIRPIPTDSDGDLRRVYVKAGYFNLKQEFRPKPVEIDKLEKDIEGLKTQLKEAEDKLAKKDKPEKRNIQDATWGDVFRGDVLVERFWFISAASGVFLGNMKVRNEMRGWQYSGNVKIHDIGYEKKAVILTNAHIASMAIEFEVRVSEDKEIMWIVYPADSFVRYTQDSDMYGSPAQLLLIDMHPVYSWDCDTAIMVTTMVPSMEPYRAILGDSKKVKEGTEVVMCGNPSMLQKFLTRGIVANTNYNLMKSFMLDRFMKDLTRERYNWLCSTSFWFDVPIGTGGTSGSGVWASEGSQKGKVIALHNAGIVRPTSLARASKEKRRFNPKTVTAYSNFDTRLDTFCKERKTDFFSDYSFKNARFNMQLNDFVQEEPAFKDVWTTRGGWVELSGLNAGVPINKIKAYLEERGLVPTDFGWEGLLDSYWLK
uniref:Putative trypsin-like peptidase domain containing protein n=1 Tax=viral metagenome TaxID=1070528 RepID=A0A6H1ZWZ8_9ZZZZ